MEFRRIPSQRVSLVQVENTSRDAHAHTAWRGTRSGSMRRARQAAPVARSCASASRACVPQKPTTRVTVERVFACWKTWTNPIPSPTEVASTASQVSHEIRWMTEMHLDDCADFKAIPPLRSEQRQSFFNFYCRKGQLLDVSSAGNCFAPKLPIMLHLSDDRPFPSRDPVFQLPAISRSVSVRGP